jgi:hypothetical protein
MPNPRSTYNSPAANEALIQTQDTAPPVQVPPGHIGPLALPGSGRLVWWTGRVAIGLRHQPTLHFGPMTQSSLWVQSVLLDGARRALASA